MNIEVKNRVELGPDSQVDKKAMVLNPRSMNEFDPFIFLAEDWFSTVGFDWHPHRGIETVSYVIDGALEHRDNKGGHGELGPGDVQWMTAGYGIVHSEKALNNEPVHMLQLWLNLPAKDKLTQAGYQDLRAKDIPVYKAAGVEIKVYSGALGDVQGPARNHVPVNFFEVNLDAGAEYALTVPESDRGFAYVLKGAGVFNGQPAQAGQVVRFAESGELKGVNQGQEGLRFLFFTGAPLNEPIASQGPFVMNTEEEIREAFMDFRAGKFGPVPEG